jgi:hypothetical protein
VILNGKRQKEPFIAPCGGGEDAISRADHDSGRPLLHDGRQPWVSDDSRSGVPSPQVDHRRAFATYWPPKRIGLL